MKCGKPLKKAEVEYCHDCKEKVFAYDQGASLWIHGELVAKGIYKFKYANRRCYGSIFAKEMAKEYEKQIQIWGIEEIIPVPLHKSRLRKRGYNQAQILAKELGERWKLPVENHAVVRIRKTAPQKELNKRERLENLKGAFAVSKNWKPKERVLILDDIYTTGSTIHRIAKVLKRAGVQKVYFLTISIGQGL